MRSVAGLFRKRQRSTGKGGRTKRRTYVLKETTSRKTTKKCCPKKKKKSTTRKHKQRKSKKRRRTTARTEISTTITTTVSTSGSSSSSSTASTSGKMQFFLVVHKCARRIKIRYKQTKTMNTFGHNPSFYFENKTNLWFVVCVCDLCFFYSYRNHSFIL